LSDGAAATPTSPLVGGPIATAIDRIDIAEAVARQARDDVMARKRAAAAAIAAHLAAADEDEDLHDLLHELYWHAPQLRVRELAEGFALPTDQVARVAGPLRVETRCDGCQAPVIWSRRTRSDRRSPRCGACSATVSRIGGLPPYAPGDPTWGALLDAVAIALDGEGCDRTLRYTTRVAVDLGLDPRSTVDAVQRRGGFCDCEVLLNVPW